MSKYKTLLNLFNSYVQHSVEGDPTNYCMRVLLSVNNFSLLLENIHINTPVTKNKITKSGILKLLLCLHFQAF